MKLAEYQTVARLDEIPDGGMIQVSAHGDPVGLYRVGTEVYAVNDYCTHEETYLTDGEFEIEDMEVECPLHGSRFDVRDGSVRILPATKPVATYPVKIEGDLVSVGPKNER
ncbi:MAG TPA: non-heme iron oxygenase ferredoxin subunit [Actinomycetota bacterium]|nr:non-heme iron oxygenase ferredoxin subunit [Actinomycetota bacterium]